MQIKESGYPNDASYCSFQTRKSFRESDTYSKKDITSPVMPAETGIQGKEDGKNLKTICMVERERHFTDKIEKEKSYYIGSLKSDAKQFGDTIRSHWGIENSLHWVLDVSFREDDSTARKGNAPENLAVLRHIALNLIKKETTAKKKSIKSKRLKAGWDNDYLMKILEG